eukprot:scaffold76185_cov36-Tisochrysis_lutea.AAC.1
MHTCLYGSIISTRFGLVPPPLEVYMADAPLTATCYLHGMKQSAFANPICPPSLFLSERSS